MVISPRNLYAHFGNVNSDRLVIFYLPIREHNKEQIIESFNH